MACAAALSGQAQTLQVTVYNLTSCTLYVNLGFGSSCTSGYGNAGACGGSVPANGSATFSSTTNHFFPCFGINASGTTTAADDGFSCLWDNGSTTTCRGDAAQAGQVYLDVYNDTGCGSSQTPTGDPNASGPNGTPPQCVTNTANWVPEPINLQNSSSQVEYYAVSFDNGGCQATNTAASIPVGWYLNGSQIQSGCGAGFPGTFLIVQPGQNVSLSPAPPGVWTQIPITSVSNCPGCTWTPPSVQVYQVNANQAVPCGLTAGSGCQLTELCNDGQQLIPSTPTYTLAMQQGTATTDTISQTNQASGIQYGGQTNNINWSPTTTNSGLALDVHMVQGFSALYDMGGQQIGVLNGINQNVVGIGNQITGAINSNTAQSVANTSVLTNVLRSLSNGVSINASNVNLNASITNWPTNFPDGSADAFHQWESNNYLSNLAGAFSWSNGYASNLFGASNASVGAWNGSGMGSFTAGASNAVADSISAVNQRTYASTSTWEIVVPWNAPTGGISNITFDLNMFDYAGVSDLAALVRQLVGWTVSIGFIVFAFGRYSDLLSEATNIAPRGPGGGSLAGMAVKAGLALILAPIVLGLFTLIVTRLVVTGLGWIFPQVSAAVDGGPISSGYGGVIESALWLCNKWVPLALCFSVTMAYAVVELGGAFIVTLAKGILMLIAAASCVVLCCQSASADNYYPTQPYKLDFWNATSNWVTLSDDQGGQYFLGVVAPYEHFVSDEFPFPVGLGLVVSSVIDANGNTYQGFMALSTPGQPAGYIIPDTDADGNDWPPGTWASGVLSMSAPQASIGVTYSLNTGVGYPQQRWPSFSWFWFGIGFSTTMFWGGYRLLYDIVLLARIDRSAPDL